jgi:hypothetical protein
VLDANNKTHNDNNIFKASYHSLLEIDSGVELTQFCRCSEYEAVIRRGPAFICESLRRDTTFE